MSNLRYAWNQFFAIWSALCFPTQNLGDSNRYGKISFGFCNQYISRKSHGSVPKSPSNFGAVVRKPGLGVNYPPPHLQHADYNRCCNDEAATEWLTSLDDASEDCGRVDGRTVPASIAELVLTLVDGVHGARLDGVHHVDVAFADLSLLFHESTELVAFLLLTYMVDGRDRRYRPEYTTSSHNEH